MKTLDGICDASDEERSDQVAQDEAMRRYVEDYRAEFGDDAVLFDPFAGELGDSVPQRPCICGAWLTGGAHDVSCVTREFGD